MHRLQNVLIAASLVLGVQTVQAQDVAPADEAAAPDPATTAEAAPDEAAAPAPAEDDMGPPEDSGGSEDDCVFGELCVGPVLTLGLFNPFGFGVHARYAEDWGFGLDYQFLSIDFGAASVSVSLITVDGRWYPGGGSFFLSGGLAFQSFSADATTVSTDMAGNVSTSTTSGEVTIPMFKLGLGLMGGDGFVMGIDLALEIPLGGTSVDFSAGSGDPDEISTLRADIQDGADVLVDFLPLLVQVNLLRIGYIF